MDTGGAATPGTVTTSVQVIGWYIAVASALILAFVVLDAMRALADRKWWFPGKFTRVNALTLAVLGVATKLPNDISTTMSGGVDQLSKLSGSALICAFIAFALPTTGEIVEPKTPHCVAIQGRVTREALVSNVMALGLLLLTTAVNICTQLVTGVISRFQVEHILVLVASFLCFGEFSMAALQDLELQLPEAGLKIESSWLAARRNSRQYMVSRSSFGFGAGATDSLCVVSFVLGIAQTQRISWKYGTESDYGWSTWWILVIQGLAILVCWASVTARWLRPLLFGAEVDLAPELANCVCLNDIWDEAALEVDVPWWRTQQIKLKLGNGRSVNNWSRLGIIKRIVAQCKKVFRCISLCVMTLFCELPIELLWRCCWKLARSKPASVLILKCLYDKEEMRYFKDEIKPKLNRRGSVPDLQGVWLCENPRGELQRAQRGCSQEELYDVNELVELLKSYDSAKTESHQYGLELSRTYWRDLHGEKPWPLSVGAAVLVLMEVWRGRGVVFEEEEVDTATKAVWQAGQVAHLVDLISNPNAKEMRETESVLADLFTTKKELVSLVSSAFRKHYGDEALSVEGIVDAVWRIGLVEDDLGFVGSWLQDFGGALRTQRPRADDNQLQWLRDTVKNHLVFILGDYFLRFPDIEKEARQIAAQYDCEELCVSAFLGSIKARRVWRSLGWGDYPIHCSFSETASHDNMDEQSQPPPVHEQRPQPPPVHRNTISPSEIEELSDILT